MSDTEYDESFKVFLDKIEEKKKKYKLCLWCFEEIRLRNDEIDSDDIENPKNFHPNCFDAIDTLFKLEKMEKI